MEHSVLELREQIDELDLRISELLKERVDRALKIQVLKKQNLKPARDDVREQEIIARYKRALTPCSSQRVERLVKAVIGISLD